MTGLIETPRTKTIGLTPLIDVVFILLMFFMLTSTFIKQREISLSTPSASNTAAAGDPQIVVLSGEMDFELFPSRQRLLNDDEILAQLSPGAPVVIRPLAQVSAQEIVTALNHLKALGFEKLNLGRALPENTGD
jgi:biopolymer transport protein ExbD